MPIFSTHFRKYFIEFCVIVLGVSVSFIAEQWRQQINDHYEIEGLFEKARVETEFLFVVDSFRTQFGARPFLKRIMEGKAVRPDSMHLVLVHGIEDGDLNVETYFPSLVALTKRSDLSTEQLHFIKYASDVVKIYGDLHRGCLGEMKKLKTMYLKYGITDDVIKLQEAHLNKSKDIKEAFFWNPMAFNMEYSGQYSSFLKDPAVQEIIKTMYINLIDQEILIIELRKSAKQAVD